MNDLKRYLQQAEDDSRVSMQQAIIRCRHALLAFEDDLRKPAGTSLGRVKYIAEAVAALALLGHLDGAQGAFEHLQGIDFTPPAPARDEERDALVDAVLDAAQELNDYDTDCCEEECSKSFCGKEPDTKVETPRPALIPPVWAERIEYAYKKGPFAYADAQAAYMRYLRDEDLAQQYAAARVQRGPIRATHSFIGGHNDD